MPGMGELLVILVIALVVFGAGKLPGIGSALGQAIGNFRRGVREVDEEAPPIASEDPPNRLPQGDSEP